MQVHGHWTVVVRSTSGKVVGRYHFHNDFNGPSFGTQRRRRGVLGDPQRAKVPGDSDVSIHGSVCRRRTATAARCTSPTRPELLRLASGHEEPDGGRSGVGHRAFEIVLQASVTATNDRRSTGSTAVSRSALRQPRSAPIAASATTRSRPDPVVSDQRLGRAEHLGHRQAELLGGVPGPGTTEAGRRTGRSDAERWAQPLLLALACDVRPARAERRAPRPRTRVRWPSSATRACRRATARRRRAGSRRRRRADRHGRRRDGRSAGRHPGRRFRERLGHRRRASAGRRSSTTSRYRQATRRASHAGERCSRRRRPTSRTTSRPRSTSAPTTRSVTAGPDPALFGTAVQLQATLELHRRRARRRRDHLRGRLDAARRAGARRCERTRLAHGLDLARLPPDRGALRRQLRLPRQQRDNPEGFYDYALSAGPDRTVLCRGPAAYTLTLSLDAGSATAGLPSSVPLAVGLEPADAASDAPATIAFTQSPDEPTAQAATVHTGVVTLGDAALVHGRRTVGRRKAARLRLLAGAGAGEKKVNAAPPLP